MFSYPSEPLLHKSQHDIHNNFIIQMSNKNINTTTAAVNVSTASNVQPVEKGGAGEDRQQQEKEREPENILSETATVVVQQQRTTVDHSFTSQINNNNNKAIQRQNNVSVPIRGSTVLTTDLNDGVATNNTKAAATQTNNTQTSGMENTPNKRNGRVGVTRSTQTIVTMEHILHALQEQQRRPEGQQRQHQEEQRRQQKEHQRRQEEHQRRRQEENQRRQHEHQRRQEEEHQRRQREQQRQQERQATKAIIKHEVQYVEIPKTGKVSCNERLDRGGRRPIVIPASDDEYPLIPIDSSDSECDNGEDIPYYPPIIDQEKPITTTTTIASLVSASAAVLDSSTVSFGRTEIIINNNREKRPIHNNDDVQKPKKKRFKRSSSVKNVILYPSVEDSELVQFYCPYKGCSTSMITKSKLFEHIRDLHDSEFRIPKYPYVLKTLSGRDIDLKNDNSRNLVKKGEKIRIVRNQDGSKGFYCPFKKCSTLRSFGDLTSIYLHLRKTHQVSVPRQERKHMGVILRYCGDILRLDETSRNLLDDKDRVTVEARFIFEKIPKVKKEEVTTKDNGYYCPYKNCAFKHLTGRNYVFKHIRRVHDRSFLPSLCGRKFILTDPQGKMITNLDEHSKDAMNIGERIKISRDTHKEEKQ